GAGTAIGCTPRASARAQLRLDRLHHSAGHHPDGTPVDRAWLERAYRQHGRTTVDIANELNCHSAYVSQLLKRHQIPARPSFLAAPSPLGRLGVELSPDIQSLAVHSHHIAWLRNLIQLTRNPPHLHLAAAARTNNIPANSIRYQLAQVERTVGFALYNRKPVTPTDRGKALLGEASRLINLLDTTA
ncbi:hypothetical protein AB0389_30380, partial [Streptomyces sp. NPDC093109]